jgi:hypothetical protein
MNRRIASLACILLLTTPLLAQSDPASSRPVRPAVVAARSDAGEAKIVLRAQSTARIGELVRLDVSESTADSFKWLLVPDSVTDFLTYDAGARACFSGRVEGEYRFIVACAKGSSVDVVTHVVRVLGPPATPQTDAFSEWIPFWNWNMDLPAEERDAMAASFEAIAARADELKEPGDWIEATAAANRKVLGERVEAWKPMLDKIGAKLLEMAQTGALSSPEDHAKVWRDIAKGLRTS